MKFTPSSKYINEILVIIEHMMNVALTYGKTDLFQADDGRFSIGPVDAQLLQTFKWVRNSLRILLWVLMQLRKGPSMVRSTMVKVAPRNYLQEERCKPWMVTIIFISAEK